MLVLNADSLSTWATNRRRRIETPSSLSHCLSVNGAQNTVDFLIDCNHIIHRGDRVCKCCSVYCTSGGFLLDKSLCCDINVRPGVCVCLVPQALVCTYAEKWYKCSRCLSVCCGKNLSWEQTKLFLSKTFKMLFVSFVGTKFLPWCCGYLSGWSTLGKKIGVGCTQNLLCKFHKYFVNIFTFCKLVANWYEWIKTQLMVFSDFIPCRGL